MKSITLPSIQAVDTIMLSLHESSRNQESGFMAEPIEDGQYVLHYPDEWESMVKSIDLSIKKVESPSTTFENFIDRLSEDQQVELVVATSKDPRLKLWYDKAVASNKVELDEDKLTNVLSSVMPTETVRKSLLRK
jgi:hypothetical protein